MSETNTVADRIRTLREHADMTQVDLGAALGVSRAHLAKIETGKDLPGRDLMMAIATHFNVSLDWLSRGQGDMRPARAINEREALLLYAYRHMPRDEADHLLDYMLKRAKPSEKAEN